MTNIRNTFGYDSEKYMEFKQICKAAGR